MPHWIRNDNFDLQRAMSMKISIENGRQAISNMQLKGNWCNPESEFVNSAYSNRTGKIKSEKTDTSKLGKSS